MMKKIIVIFILIFTLISCSSVNESLFEDISNVYFIYTNVTSGGSTEIYIAADRTFHGAYFNFALGNFGEGYMSGKFHYCAFNGKFTSGEKLNEFEYSIKCKSLVIDEESSRNEITGDISDEPFGIKNADEFRLYLPGMKVSDLPQEFLDTMWMYINEGDETISFYGLYNVGRQTCFISFTRDD